MDERSLELRDKIKDALSFDDYVKKMWCFDGYEIHSVPQTKKKFPDCCDFHTAAHKDIKNWFKDFPDCCDQHKRLKSTSWFDKNYYNYVPEKIACEIDLTLRNIFKHINQEDGYRSILENITNTIFGFGIFSIGADKYLKHLKIYLKNFNSTTGHNKIIDFIECHETNVTVNLIEEGSIRNPLIRDFEHWYTLFPFKLSLFNQIEHAFRSVLKEHPISDETYLINQILMDESHEVSFYHPIRRKERDFVKDIDSLTLSIFKNHRYTCKYDVQSKEELMSVRRELVLYKQELNRIIFNRSKDFYMYRIFLGINSKYEEYIEEWLDKEIIIVTEFITIVEHEKAKFNVSDSKKDHQISTTKEKIEYHFNIILGNQKWKYAFRNEEDYTTFVELLANYFEIWQYEDNCVFETPEETIDMKNRTQNRLSRALNAIHGELTKHNLRGHTKFFDILRVLSHYKNLTDSEIESKLTK